MNKALIRWVLIAVSEIIQTQKMIAIMLAVMLMKPLDSCQEKTRFAIEHRRYINKKEVTEKSITEVICPAILSLEVKISSGMMPKQLQIILA